MAKAKLKPKQEKFCIEFAKCGNIRQAYLKAGYTCSGSAADASGSKLLKNPNVQQRLQELAEEAANEQIADVREMQKVLTDIIRKNIDEEIVIVNNVDVVHDRKEPSLKDIVNAINTLAKMQGAFTEKVSIDGAIPVVISGEDGLEE